MKSLSLCTLVITFFVSIFFSFNKVQSKKTGQSLDKIILNRLIFYWDRKKQSISESNWKESIENLIAKNSMVCESIDYLSIRYTTIDEKKSVKTFFRYGSELKFKPNRRITGPIFQCSTLQNPAAYVKINNVSGDGVSVRRLFGGEFQLWVDFYDKLDSSLVLIDANNVPIWIASHARTYRIFSKNKFSLQISISHSDKSISIKPSSNEVAVEIF